MGSQEHGEEVTDAAFDRVAETHREFVQSYVGRYTLIEKGKLALHSLFILLVHTPLN